MIGIMTITEVARDLREFLCGYVDADKSVSAADRNFFTAGQKKASDEEVISFWLSISRLDANQVPMFVAKKFAAQAEDIDEWMTLLDQNTVPPEEN